MKQIKLLSAFSGLLFMTLGCQKEDNETKPLSEVQVTDQAKKLTPLGACTPSFYYYINKERSLGNASTQRIVVGFTKQITTEEKKLILTSYGNLDQVIYETNTGSADATVVSLKNVYDCGHVDEILNTLKLNPEILYANPVYDNADATNYIGITNQFFVNLKNESSESSFKSLAAKTNVKIVDKLSNLSFIVSADKNSEGNALEMANLFYQNLNARYSEPDFLYLRKQPL
ncbi:hypothetical protein [Adhaeribacter aquaticus]|uniref:hypothetical protein n=1 Tax=Adhaeribacter aquaticus TaxID=299567 RepID=UPI00041D7252|nr:hypothetical protein [Adhaeribacter aquaticus]